MYREMCSTSQPLKTRLDYWIMWLCRASNVQCAFMSVLSFHQFVKRKRLKTTLHSLYVLCQFELYIRGLLQRNSTRRLKANSSRFLCSAATLTATRLPPHPAFSCSCSTTEEVKGRSWLRWKDASRSLAKPEGREQKLWPQKDAHMEDDVHSLVESKHKLNS